MPLMPGAGSYHVERIEFVRAAGFQRVERTHPAHLPSLALGDGAVFALDIGADDRPFVEQEIRNDDADAFACPHRREDGR